MSLRCRLFGHANVVKYEKPLPGGGAKAVEFRCCRCDKLIYGGMTPVEVET